MKISDITETSIAFSLFNRAGLLLVHREQMEQPLYSKPIKMHMKTVGGILHKCSYMSIIDVKKTFIAKLIYKSKSEPVGPVLILLSFIKVNL